jgi:hypothetical protein
MTIFYITIPLMVLAVAVAVLPVLLGSVRHHRAMIQRQLETPESADQEADFWHHMLGHRTVEDYAPTPDLVNDQEVLRVGVPEERRIRTDPSVWRVPAKA